MTSAVAVSTRLNDSLVHSGFIASKGIGRSHFELPKNAFPSPPDRCLQMSVSYSSSIGSHTKTNAIRPGLRRSSHIELHDNMLGQQGLCRRQAVLSVSVFPLGFVGPIELPGPLPTEIIVSDFQIAEATLKTFYLVFVCVFCWGAVVFGSMNDAYYDSDEYREGGGNGTQYYLYARQEDEEEDARKELWREELLKEIEGRVGEVKVLPVVEETEEKEKELV